jgi:anaerobic ribonucleoside-triphosphate reductase activating protein
MDILYCSAVDGTGFRDVLFVSGCPHRCDGCHNPDSWNGENGNVVSLQEVYDKLTKSGVTNITYSGGEPFEQAAALARLTAEIKANTGKTVWVYSGYTFEQIVLDEEKRKLLELCDVLVDGRYEKDNTVLNLRFKGSLNQRIVDVKKSLAAGAVVLCL